jgi:hypothetical protein
VVSGGAFAAPLYQARTAAAFPERDGRSCERVVAEIEQSTIQVSLADAVIPIPAPADPSEASVSAGSRPG